jgi:hypothetical protein
MNVSSGALSGVKKSWKTESGIEVWSSVFAYHTFQFQAQKLTSQVRINTTHFATYCSTCGKQMDR